VVVLFCCTWVVSSVGFGLFCVFGLLCFGYCVGDGIAFWFLRDRFLLKCCLFVFCWLVV